MVAIPDKEEPTGTPSKTTSDTIQGYVVVVKGGLPNDLSARISTMHAEAVLDRENRSRRCVPETSVPE